MGVNNVGAFFKRYGWLTFWLLFVLPVGTAFVWWVIIAAGGYNGGVERVVNLTHDWMGLLTTISEKVPGLGWATNRLQGWKDGLPGVFYVKNVADIPDDKLLHIWAVWAITFVAIWLIVVIVSAVLSGFFGWSLGGNRGGNTSGGGGNGGGGGGGTTTTISPTGFWQLAMHHLRAPLNIALVLIVLGSLGFWFFDKVWERYEDFGVQQTYQERLEADGVSCVPDSENVLQLDQVDACVGVLHSSSASKATKESLTIVLGATCTAYDAYAAMPTATPAWERRANRDVSPSVYGEKAEWMAEQGIPCSVKMVEENGSGPGLLGWLNTVLLLAIIGAAIAAITLKIWPLEDGAGTPIPFTDERTLKRLATNTVKYTGVLLLLVFLASIFI